MMLGFHCSISGGMLNAVAQAREAGLDTFQVFTKNQRQWRDKVISHAGGKQFQKGMQEAGIKQVIAHGMYLMNLASSTETIREKSEIALESELRRCEALGIAAAVLHPGSNSLLSYEESIEMIASGVRRVMEATEGLAVRLLLENTAGQGRSTGYRLEHLQQILDSVRHPRLGICIDTCHAFAAGYDLRHRDGIELFFEGIDVLIGLDRLSAFHLNDSKGDLGSRIDRHAHIGKGKLGLEVFSYIMSKFPHIPKILETGHEGNLHLDDLALLRSLVGP